MKQHINFAAASLLFMGATTANADFEQDWNDFFNITPPERILSQLGADPDSFYTPTKGPISSNAFETIGDFFSYGCDTKNDKGHTIPSVALVTLPTAGITYLAIGAVEFPFAATTAMAGEWVATASELGGAPYRIHRLAQLPAQQLVSWGFDLSIATAASPPVEALATVVDSISNGTCSGLYAVGDAMGNAFDAFFSPQTPAAPSPRPAGSVATTRFNAG